MKIKTTLAAALALAWSAASFAALQNSNFAEFDAPADGTTAGYDVGEGPPGWYLTAATNGGSVIYDASEAFEGVGGYWVFEPPLTTGFGANKFEQCVPVNDTDTLEISYAIHAETPTDDAAELAVRVNPNFYADLASCLDAQETDSGGDRLSDGGSRPNDDVDFTFGSDDGRQWIERTPAVEPELRYTVDHIPDGSRYMNLSIRMRDRPTPRDNVRIRLDNVHVVQGGSTNRVVNGRFEHAPLADGAPLVATGNGWVVDRDGDAALKAAVGPVGFALSGSNVFYIENMTGNFGSSRLDQCFPLEGADIRPSVFAQTRRPDPELQVRLNVDFYTDDACTSSAASDPRIRQDFALDGTAREWTALIAEEVRSAGEYGDATHGLLSIRVRDRSNEAGDGPGAFPRAVYLDDASVAAGVATPTFSPSPGEYVDSVEVTLESATADAVIYYTLDGSDPDDSAANVPSGGTVQITSTSTLTARAFADGLFSSARSGDYTIVGPPPPPPPPPAQLSTGCSVSDRPAPLDPTLWALMALAGAALYARRRRRALKI